MLLPLIQDIELSGEAPKRRANTNIKNYIYLQEGNKILKFYVDLSYWEILKILEKHINNKNINDYTIITQQEVEKNNIPFNVIPYLGNFRLEGNFRRTDNYLVPKDSDHLFLWLCEKIEERDLFNQDLECLYKIAKIAFEDGENEQLKTIKEITHSTTISFIERYTIDYNELANKINELKSKSDKSKLEKLEWIFKTAKENKKYLKSFGLYDKFIEVAGLTKQNQKVK